MMLLSWEVIMLMWLRFDASQLLGHGVYEIAHKSYQARGFAFLSVGHTSVLGQFTYLVNFLLGLFDRRTIVWSPWYKWNNPEENR